MADQVGLEEVHGHVAPKGGTHAAVGKGCRVTPITGPLLPLRITAPHRAGHEARGDEARRTRGLAPPPGEGRGRSKGVQGCPWEAISPLSDCVPALNQSGSLLMMRTPALTAVPSITPWRPARILGMGRVSSTVGTALDLFTLRLPSSSGGFLLDRFVFFPYFFSTGSSSHT